MSAFASGVTFHCLGICHCWAQPWTLWKHLNRLRCRLGRELAWNQATVCWVWLQTFIRFSDHLFWQPVVITVVVQVLHDVRAGPAVVAADADARNVTRSAVPARLSRRQHPPRHSQHQAAMTRPSPPMPVLWWQVMCTGPSKLRPRCWPTRPRVSTCPSYFPVDWRPSARRPWDQRAVTGSTSLVVAYTTHGPVSLAHQASSRPATVVVSLKYMIATLGMIGGDAFWAVWSASKVSGYFYLMSTVLPVGVDDWSSHLSE